MDAISRSIPDWKIYLSNQYKSEFSDETARFIREAVIEASKRGREEESSPTVNTKDLLSPLMKNGGPLRGLRLDSYIGGNFGIPPWHEHPADPTSLLQLANVYGSARPSRDFHGSLQTAASLVSTTPGLEEVTPWHLAIALLSSKAAGIAWRLQVGNSSIDQAVDFLITKMDREQPDLYSKSPWRERFHLPKNSGETKGTAGMDRSGALDHLEIQWARFLTSKKWAGPIEEGLGRAREFQKWMVQEAPAFGSSSTHSPISSLPLRLSEEVIVLSLIILATEISRGNRALDKARQPEWAMRFILSEDLSRERLKSLLQRAFFRAQTTENSADKFRLIPSPLQKILDRAETLARSISDSRIDERHFVLASLIGEDATNFASALNQEGIRVDRLIEALSIHVREDASPTSIDAPNGWLGHIAEVRKAFSPSEEFDQDINSSSTAAPSGDKSSATT